MSIQINKELNVQLQCNERMVPFPSPFVQGQNAELTIFSLFLNFFLYMKNNTSENEYSALENYTPVQAYELLLNKYPLLPISILNKIQEGVVKIPESSKNAKQTFRGLYHNDCDVHSNWVVNMLVLMKTDNFTTGSLFS